MKRYVWVILVAVAIGGDSAASQARPPAQQTPERPRIEGPNGEWTLEADTFGSLPGNPAAYRASGRVVITRGTDRLFADEAPYDSVAGDATLRGTVLLNLGGNNIHAASATYNVQTRSGRAQGVRTTAQGVIIMAAEIQVEPDRWVATNASVTACMGPDPHWELVGGTIELIPNVRWLARDVGLEFFGRRLITVRQVGRDISPREGAPSGLREAQQFAPTLGYNNRDGFFLEKDLDLVQSRRLAASLNLNLGTGRGLRGALEAGTGGLWRMAGAVSYREDAPNQRARFLELTRLPELGVIYGRRTAARAGQFLPQQIAGVAVPRNAPELDRWVYAAQASGGFFMQRRGEGSLPENVKEEGSRVLLQAQAARPRLRLSDGVSLDNLRVMIRQSFYSSGDRYTVAGMGIGKHWKLGPLTAGVERLSHATEGRSPFLFDEVEIEEEWRPRAELRAGGWNASWHGRYDERRGGWYDHRIALGHRMDCIDFRAGYSTRRDQFTFDIRLLGLEPGFREQEATPPPLDQGTLAPSPPMKKRR